MRFHSYTFGPLLFVYSGTLLLALYLVYHVWASGTVARTEGYYQGTVSMAVVDPKQREAGIKGCKEILRTNPRNLDARFYQALLLYQDGQFKEAREAFETAAESSRATSEKQAWAYTGAAVCAYRQSGGKEGQARKDAENLLKKALEKDPKSMDARINLALLNELNGASGASWLEEAGKLEKAGCLQAQVHLYNLQGMQAFRKKNWDQAEAHFRSVRGIQPQWELAERNLKHVLALKAELKKQQAAQKAAAPTGKP
jgi:tetratricopeptide (TPR) repeat protein